MIRKAGIIALIISSIYLVIGQVMILGDFSFFFENYLQPENSLSPSQWILVQIGTYLFMGYLIYRLMFLHRLMIQPVTPWLLMTFLLWEVFKWVLLSWHLPNIALFVLFCFLIMLIVLVILLYREDGILGTVTLPILAFHLLYVLPWYFQLVTINYEATQQ